MEQRMKTLQASPYLASRIMTHLIKQILGINKNSWDVPVVKTDLNDGIFVSNQMANIMLISFRTAPIYLLMLIYIHHWIDWMNIEANTWKGMEISQAKSWDKVCVYMIQNF